MAAEPPAELPAVAIGDPEFRTIGKAIRLYLRNDYAYQKMGLGEAPPLRISAFNGKGVGRYPTAPDGRPEQSPEFERYIERGEQRSAVESQFKFGYKEVSAVLERMKALHYPWYQALMFIDVENGTAEDLAKHLGVDLSTVKRRRKRGTFAIYAALRITPERSTRVIETKSIPLGDA